MIVSFLESRKHKELYSYLGKDQDSEGETKMEFEIIEPNVWKSEKEGDSVEGTLISQRDEVGPNKSKTYHLEKDKEQIMVWGSTVLDSRMDFVNIGDYVRITFKGTQKNTKGQDTKIFQVERSKDKEIK